MTRTVLTVLFGRVLFCHALFCRVPETHYSKEENKKLFFFAFSVKQTISVIAARLNGHHIFTILVNT
uniref:Putative secreted protein n=1 Tax=Ixodes ricinus TaxID=34613 RepID=A0A6B0U0E7_IXORI